VVTQTVTNPGWVLLTYKVPREPSAARVSLWRKLKAAGAHLVHDSVWVLPYTPPTRETFQWLADETRERGGQATLWTADPFLESEAQAMRQVFRDQADESYRAILKRLKSQRADPAKLAAEYQRALRIDYFGSELGERVREALMVFQQPRAPRKARTR
jgi:hypothetical protein